MAIWFVGGLPRAGKTAYMVSELIRELRRTRRPIVTNMALRLQPWVDGGGVARVGLLKALVQRYGTTFDAERRIVILENSQVERFYACRPDVPREEWRKRKVRWLKPVNDKGDEMEPGSIEAKKNGHFRFTKRDPAVAQFIDEAHETFNSRKWQQTGSEALSWASQSARAGDECHLATQVIGNVEKQFRGVSQGCYWFVNHKFLRFFMFRHPDTITYSLYASTPPSDGESPLDAGKIKYDVDLVRACYDTASGVGVEGNAADIGQRSRGIPMWILPVVLCTLFVALGLGVHYVQTAGVRASQKWAREHYRPTATAKVAAPAPATNSEPWYAKSPLVGQSHEFKAKDDPVIEYYGQGRLNGWEFVETADGLCYAMNGSFTHTQRGLRDPASGVVFRRVPRPPTKP